MKILQINKFFYMKGGPERSMFSTAQLLEKNGHKVIFFSMQHPANNPSPYSTYFTSSMDIEDKNLINKFKLSLRLLYSKEAYKKISLLCQILI